MFAQIGQLLVDVVASFVVYLLLARFLLQCVRAPFRNPVGEFVIAATNWAVLPLRRILPPLAGLDSASLAGAWLVQLAALSVAHALRGVEFGGDAAALALLLAALALVDLLRFGLYLFGFVLIVQAVLSWVNPYTPLAPLFDALTRPLLRPLRRWVPPVANVDLTPLVALVAIQVLLIPLAYLRAMVGGLG